MSSHDDLYSSLIPYRLGDFLRMIASWRSRHGLDNAGCQIDRFCSAPNHILSNSHRVATRAASAISYADYLYILIGVFLELSALLPDCLEAACAWTLIQCALTPDDPNLHHSC